MLGLDATYWTDVTLTGRAIGVGPAGPAAIDILYYGIEYLWPDQKFLLEQFF